MFGCQWCLDLVTMTRGADRLAEWVSLLQQHSLMEFFDSKGDSSCGCGSLWYMASGGGVVEAKCECALGRSYLILWQIRSVEVVVVDGALSAS